MSIRYSVQKAELTVLESTKLLTCTKTSLVDGFDLRPQVADSCHVICVPSQQAPNDTVSDCEVLPQNQGLVMG
jgi:hypothetical protein